MITWRERRRDGETQALGLVECSSKRKYPQQNMLQDIELRIGSPDATYLEQLKRVTNGVGSPGVTLFITTLCFSRGSESAK